MLGLIGRNSSKLETTACLNSWLLKSSPSALQSKRDLCLGIIPDSIDRNSDTFMDNSQLMQDLLSQLRSNINKVSLSLFDARFYLLHFLHFLDINHY